MAWRAGKPVEARTLLEQARTTFAERGDTRAAARASARLAEIDFSDGHPQQAVARLEPALDALEAVEPDEDLAVLAERLGRFLIFNGENERAAPHLERALSLAEALDLPETLAHALNSKSILLLRRDRPYEARILLEGALALALAHHLHAAAFRTYNNLAALLYDQSERWADVLTITDRGLELARRVGDRYSEAIFLAGHVSPLVMLGRWDEAQARAGEAEELATTSFVESILLEAVGIHGERGALEQARQLLTRLTAVAQSEETEAVAGYAITEARLLRAEGRPSEALAAAERALVLCAEIGATSGSRKLALVEALEAAAALDDTDTVRQLLATLDQLRPGELTPFLKAQRARFRARLTEHEADTEFSTAEELFREHDTPFYLAVTQLEHAERLAAHGRADQAEPLLTQAREIFQRLQAKPWLDRLAAAQTQQPTQARA